MRDAGGVTALLVQGAVLRGGPRPFLPDPLPQEKISWIRFSGGSLLAPS